MAHKTDYAGSISRFRRSFASCQIRPHHVTAITGHGGTELTLTRLIAAARRCPEWQWTVLGPIADDAAIPLPANLHVQGIVADPLPWLASAHVVVGSAGDSLVSEIAELRCRFICVPESRPFDEQQSVGALLADAGLAVHCAVWPTAESWPFLLDRAIRLSPAKWESFADGHGARRAACAIRRLRRSSATNLLNVLTLVHGRRAHLANLIRGLGQSTVMPRAVGHCADERSALSMGE